MEKSITNIQKTLNIKFKDTQLLRQALTHSSYAKKKILKTPFFKM